MKANNGSTLIELLTTLAISLLLISGAITIYLTINSAQKMQIAIEEINENTSIVTNLLREAIHHAGYTGCVKLSNDIQINNSTLTDFSIKNKIQSDGEMVTIKAASENSEKLLKNMYQNNSVTISRESNYKIGDILLISDCNTTDIFKIQKIYNNDEVQNIMTNHDLTKLYAINTEVRKLETITFFVANTKRVNISGTPIKALFEHRSGSKINEVIEGINKMQITFDKNEDNDPIGASIKIELSDKNNLPIVKPIYLYVALKN